MKKKLLIISINKPYPLAHGGAVAQYFFLERLVYDFDVDFLTIIHSVKEKESLQNLQSEIKGLNIIYFDNSPIPQKIIIRLISYLNSFLFQIYYLVKNKLVVPNSEENFYKFANKGFVRFISDHLKSNSYDICQLEFFETLNLLPLLPVSLKKVFIHHEIRFKKHSNMLDLQDDYNKYFIQITKLFEISLLNKFNKVVVFNDYDLKELEKIKDKVELSAFGIPDKLIIKKEFSRVFNFFFFLGSEIHAPNRDGLVWFLDTIFIPNHKIINKPIKILGNWSEDFKNKYSNHSFIEFTGFVDSLLVIYQEGVLVAPIISGSGIRTKILESFANKVPVVCTSFAAEGLFDDKNNEHLLFFNDTASFIEVVNKSLKNETERNIIVKNGFVYYNTNFNSELLYQKRLNIYNDL